MTEKTLTMKRYEFSAFVVVHAETEEVAREIAGTTAYHASKSGEVTIGLEDGEPVVEDLDA